jgi:hypothetical protein
VVEVEGDAVIALQISIMVDGETVLMWQPFAAADVLRLGGLVGDGIVIRTDGGRASRFAPEVPVSFDVRPVFRTFRGAVHSLWVGGLLWEWGAPLIPVAEVRSIKRIGAGVTVRLQGVDGGLPTAALIDLTTIAPPRFITRASSPAG